MLPVNIKKYAQTKEYDPSVRAGFKYRNCFVMRANIAIKLHVL